jgi:FkbM family methyltransferase
MSLNEGRALMFLVSQAKQAVRHTIATHRRSPPMIALHKAAEFFDAAWRNEGSDLGSNGERFVIDRLRRADFRLAIDAGAHTGDWSLQALSAWPTCQVIHAFEVAPRTFDELADARMRSEDRARLIVHPQGLSDSAGKQTMYFFPEDPQLTCDIARHDSRKSVPFEATLTTLDAFCSEKGIDTVDFLKIDVEGAEHRVLKGADQILRRTSCVQFEYGPFSIQTRFLLQDYFALLSDRFWIGKVYPNYIAFGDYDWREENFRFCNYLCVAKARPELRSMLAR